MKRSNSIKILIIFLVTSLLVSGIYYFNKNHKQFEYNGQWYQAGEMFRDVDDCNSCSFDKNGQLQCTMMACDPISVLPEGELIDIRFDYGNDAYKYTGTIQTPTPCHTVETEQVIREKFPEDVDLKFAIQDSGNICTEVIDQKEVSGQIKVSEKATIRVYINDTLQDDKGIN
jgi:hypothetical protein